MENWHYDPILMCYNTKLLVEKVLKHVFFTILV
jgi:hypothetical protein